VKEPLDHGGGQTVIPHQPISLWRQTVPQTVEVLNIDAHIVVIFRVMHDDCGVRIGVLA
jgi:hypothetical protein